MIIDSSALVAILLKEIDALALTTAIASCPRDQRFIAAPTLVETKIVIYNRNIKDGMADLQLFINRSGIQALPFTETLANIAFESHRIYHPSPAHLNFGDCFSYALAKARNEPLLCKRNDFKHTDIHLVQY